MEKSSPSIYRDVHALANSKHKGMIGIKGQLISKCIFGIFNSPKKRSKKFDFTTMVIGTSSRIEDNKKTSRN